MSKKIIFLLYCFLFIGITMQASATSSKLTEIVSAVERAVDVVPDGSICGYYICWYGNSNSKS